MTTKVIEIPPSYIIEELEELRRKEQEYTAPLQLPIPIYPDKEQEPEKKVETVITIQL